MKKFSLNTDPKLGKDDLTRINQILKLNGCSETSIHRLARLSGKGTCITYAMESGNILGFAYYSLVRCFTHSIAHIQAFVDTKNNEYAEVYKQLVADRVDRASKKIHQSDGNPVKETRRKSLEEISVCNIETEELHFDTREEILVGLGFTVEARQVSTKWLN